jgi:phosphatidate phosphatase APP1
MPSRTASAGEASNLKPDHEVVFYPSLAFPVDGGKKWRCEIHGRVFKPDQRRILLGVLQRGLRLGRKLTASEIELFKERARLFMVDNKRGRKVLVRLADQVVTLSRSKANGHFSGSVVLARELLNPIEGARLKFEAILSDEDERTFTGEVSVCSETGVTVISDIDDTIRITQVRDRRANFCRTFLRPFEAVPGMAEVYRRWAGRYDARFCYVSASPWQLFSPLREFVAAHEFPTGAFFLRNFRWKDRSLLNVLASPRKYKIGIIERLLKTFSTRTFVLVGDTGERDPEIYAEMARRFPGQILRVFLRDVTGEPGESARYRKLFGSLQGTAWTLFRDPAEISDIRF